jgi:hypothetical protein
MRKQNIMRTLNDNENFIILETNEKNIDQNGTKIRLKEKIYWHYLTPSFCSKTCPESLIWKKLHEIIK